MADFKDVINTLDKAADGFGNIANAEQKKIYEEVVTLAKDLETDAKGKVKQTITNLKRLNQIKAKLASLSKDKEWVAGIGKFVKYFDILQKQQNAYFSTAFPQLTLGESAKKRNEMMKQIAVNNTIEALMGDGLKANVTDKLNDILLRGVTSGAKWADLQQELRDHLMGKEGGQGAFARYATTYATTALSQYTGQHNQLLTKDLGLEWFMYVGSNIETTREFCEVLTKKKWIHKSEIPTILQGKIEMPDGEVVEVAIYEKTGLPKGMIADTTPENFQCNCGGWNCRHQLLPVADAMVPAAIRAKFDKQTQEEIAKQKAEEERKKAEEAKKQQIAELQKQLEPFAKWKDLPVSGIQSAVAAGDIPALEKYIGNLHDIESALTKLTMLVEPEKAMQEFTLSELQAVNDAVVNKMQQFASKGITGEQLAKKLQFEAQWVQDNKKYPTWQIAQQAYNKQLAEVQKDIALNQLQPEVSKLVTFKTKSKPYKALAAELTDAYQNGDVEKVQQLVGQMQSEISRIERRRNPNANGNVIFSDDSYSQSRKDAALWHKNAYDNKQKTDAVLRKQTSEIWLSSSEIAKDAAFSYTEGSCYLNEPLRGMTYTGRKGNETFRNHCNALTDMIARAKRPFDYWVQRGEYEGGLGARFGINLRDYIHNPQALVGKVGFEGGFLSTGSTKYTGFKEYPVISNIYCPRGTEGLYCEPFSFYGRDVNGKGDLRNEMAGRNWDGTTKQRYFGNEFETLLQRGTSFRIIKAEYSGGRWYIDMEIIKQEYTAIK